LSELHRPQLRELHREFDQPQRRAFVDIQSVFDSVDRE